MPFKDPEKRKRNHAQYMREKWYPSNKETHIALVHNARVKRRKSIKSVVDEIKSAPCVDCGNQFPPIAMDFDHVSGPKISNVSQMIRTHTLQQVLDEIDKCDLVCAVCHRIRTERRLQENSVASVEQADQTENTI